MAFKSFRTNFITRVILIVASIFGCSYLLFNTNLTLTLCLASIITVAQIVGLIHYIDRTNRILNNFLESIRYSDFTRTFQIEGLDATFDRLKKSFNEVIKDFQKVRAEKEENRFYLQTIIQHIGIALIAFRPNGNVELINNATKKLFQINNLTNIQYLKTYNPELTNRLFSLKNGENTLIKVQEGDNILQLSIYATEFQIHNRNITLVSIKNIQNELDEKELESWQKLIRVLTHEIMNSITPIASLSSTISLLMEEIKNNPENPDNKENIEEISEALNTINKRTNGLLHFVNTYRNLTQVPTPCFSIFSIRQLFNNIKALFENEIAQNNINCHISINPKTLELSADKHLLEQVIINLIKNAIHATQNKTERTIELRAYFNSRGRITMQVKDNGQGILPEVLDKIFIPFFTTKQKGSGIGLSLSRQILRLHGATITATSIPEEETKFTITF